MTAAWAACSGETRGAEARVVWRVVVIELWRQWLQWLRTSFAVKGEDS